MRILMVGNDSTVKGGITTVINQIKKFDWDKKNIKIYFIPTYIDKNIVHKFIFFFFGILRVICFFIIKKPDAVHIHVSYKGSFYRKKMIQDLCILFKIKNIVHLHGSEFKKWYNELSIKKKNKVKAFVKNADLFIVLGEKWEKIILEIEPDANVKVLNNSIETHNEMVKWNDKGVKLLFLGTLIKRKGVYDLLDVINEIVKENNLKIELIISGTGVEEKNLKLITTKYNLNDIVKYTGWIDNREKEKVLKECQILILPSYNEGLPMSILESINYGMPIISTNVGDIALAVEDNVNGFLIQPRK